MNAGLNVLSLFITLYLVRKDENSDYKIIWLVLIGLMPLLGGALYLAFGNKAPAKRMRQRMQAVERQHTADLAQQPGQTEALDPASRGLCRYIADYGPYPAWKDTTAKYYPCGEEMYPDLLADLEGAERFIFLEFFIVRTGRMWGGVEDILVRKAGWTSGSSTTISAASWACRRTSWCGWSGRTSGASLSTPWCRWCRWS